MEHKPQQDGAEFPASGSKGGEQGVGGGGGGGGGGGEWREVAKGKRGRGGESVDSPGRFPKYLAISDNQCSQDIVCRRRY